MKLLFDQNISFRIIKLIINHFPDAKQVRELGLENNSDSAIWEFARKNNYHIVTFDADFIDLCNLKGFPPKIIWLRFGNTTTQHIVACLIEKKDTLEVFILNDEQAFIELM